MLRPLQIAIAAGMLLIRFSTALHAQSQTTGRIAGSVSDQTGAVIEAAGITATSIGGPAERDHVVLEEYRRRHPLDGSTSPLRPRL